MINPFFLGNCEKDTLLRENDVVEVCAGVYASEDPDNIKNFIIDAMQTAMGKPVLIELEELEDGNYMMLRTFRYMERDPAVGRAFNGKKDFIHMIEVSEYQDVAIWSFEENISPLLYVNDAAELLSSA